MGLNILMFSVLVKDSLQHPSALDLSIVSEIKIICTCVPVVQRKHAAQHMQAHADRNASRCESQSK